MKWLKVKTLEDFKKLGSYKDLRQEIQNNLSERIELKARGWEELWEAVQAIQKLSSNNFKESQESKVINTTDDNLLYFKSKADKIIYALVELDEEYRLKALGVDRSHYRDSNKAKQWRNELAKIIHPDLCIHPKAALAINKLTELFENMVGK